MQTVLLFPSEFGWTVRFYAHDIINQEFPYKRDAHKYASELARKYKTTVETDDGLPVGEYEPVGPSLKRYTDSRW